VPWRELEALLDALAQARFPINPEIRHGAPLTTVELPAYSGQVEEIRALLGAAKLSHCPMEIRNEWPRLAASASHA